MKKSAILLFFIFCAELSSGQTDTLATDKVLINLTITDIENKRIETDVKIENSKTHNSLQFKTNKQGYAACLVATGENYTISIPGSDESYGCNIPDFTGSPLDLTLKFNINNDPRAATKTNAVITVKLCNNPGLKDIKLVGKKSFAGTAIISNDVAFIKLPMNQEYTIDSKGFQVKNNNITVDNTEYNLLYYALYFNDAGVAELIPVKQDQAVVFVTYKNLFDKPVPAENLTLKSKGTEIEYKIFTAANGTGLVLVPKNDSYSLSLKYFQDFASIDIADNKKNVMTAHNILVNYPSSIEYENEKKRIERMIATRDSLYAMFEKEKELKDQKFRDKIKKELTGVIKELKQDPQFFEKKNNVVCAVLHRNRLKWQSKMIVTDVTGSMYPYMEQVALWHLLEMMDERSSEYVFFNDGNNMPDDQKVIGETGGIYTNLTRNSDSIIKTMSVAMGNGSGGDSPENDIEALIKAQGIRSGPSELILVADALSAVKDISLLKSLKVPVRIILCGSDRAVNIDYLEIAYKTGGSIHTIEKDIFELSQLHDGDILKLGTVNYRFTRGRFFPVTLRL